MNSELVNILTDFSGQANHICCFTHIINLVAKSLIKLFEVKKKNQYDVLTNAENDLQQLADIIDMEDLETQIRAYQGHGVGTEGVDDDNNILDKIGKMDEFEMAGF